MPQVQSQPEVQKRVLGQQRCHRQAVPQTKQINKSYKKEVILSLERLKLGASWPDEMDKTWALRCSTEPAERDLLMSKATRGGETQTMSLKEPGRELDPGR